MRAIYAYLTFNGNCREAMEFYQQCLGGELVFQTVGAPPMPKKMKDVVLHVTLTNGNMVLMGTDIVPDMGLIKGNSVSLALTSTNKRQVNAWYKKLSISGQATQPLQPTNWGALFGTLTDKFGNHWLLNYSKTKKQANDKRTANKNTH